MARHEMARRPDISPGSLPVGHLLNAHEKGMESYWPIFEPHLCLLNLSIVPPIFNTFFLLNACDKMSKDTDHPIIYLLNVRPLSNGERRKKREREEKVDLW